MSKNFFKISNFLKIEDYLFRKYKSEEFTVCWAGENLQVSAIYFKQ